MDPTSTVVLVRRAREGDRDAWSALVDRYYEQWLRKYHGRLGASVRKIYDTQDVVQSAIGDAMRDIAHLQHEAVFFSWVTSIVRHKLARARRKLTREERLGTNSPGLVEKREPGPDEPVTDLDSYLHTLDMVLELFPNYPEHMAAVTMKLLDGCSVREIAERFRNSERTAYDWLRQGTDLLKARLVEE